MDIHFLLDESGSVGITNYYELCRFVKQFAPFVGPDALRIGVSSFGDRVQHHFWMGEHLNQSEVEEGIRGVARNYARA